MKKCVRVAVHCHRKSASYSWLYENDSTVAQAPWSPPNGFKNFQTFTRNRTVLYVGFRINSPRFAWAFPQLWALGQRIHVVAFFGDAVRAPSVSGSRRHYRTAVVSFMLWRTRVASSRRPGLATRKHVTDLGPGVSAHSASVKAKYMKPPHSPLSKTRRSTAPCTPRLAWLSSKACVSKVVHANATSDMHVLRFLQSH